MNLPFWRKLHVVMMMAGFTHGGIYTQNLHAGFTHDGGFYTRKLHAEITHGGGKYTWYHDPASGNEWSRRATCEQRRSLVVMAVGRTEQWWAMGG